MFPCNDSFLYTQGQPPLATPQNHLILMTSKDTAVYHFQYHNARKPFTLVCIMTHCVISFEHKQLHNGYKQYEFDRIRMNVRITNIWKNRGAKILRCNFETSNNLFIQAVVYDTSEM